MNKIFCPNCYTEFDKQAENCSCGYPFKGSDMDKYQFMSKNIQTAKTIHEGIKSADYARFILFIIGGINLLVSMFILITTEYDPIHIVTFIYSLLLIGLGFFSFKEPFVSLLVGFILLLMIYLGTGLIDPRILFSGLIMKIVFVAGFIVGLVKIKQAERILK